MMFGQDPTLIDYTHPAQRNPYSEEYCDYEAGYSVGTAMKRILTVAEECGYPARAFDGLKERIEDDFLEMTDIHPTRHADRYENWKLGVTEALEACK